MLQKIKTLIVFVLLCASAGAQSISGFENLNLPIDSFENGKNVNGGFQANNAFFVNNYDTSFGGIWSGFALSSKRDTLVAGYMNQYSARPGSGYKGSQNYLVANGYGVIKARLSGAAAGKAIQGFYITNSTYSYLSMRDGDGIGKKFGGVSGNDPDFFKLQVSGWFNGSPKNDTIEFYLADFRSGDNSKDYIVKSWTWFDLKALGNVDSLSFTLRSSDVGQFGMNTPAYFCLDHFVARNHPVFDPGANHPSHKAIHADSSILIHWANGCTINRGLQNISNSSAGFASAGDSTMALGKAGSNGIVSLGDGGSATLTFPFPIRNGSGPDFAVFENSFLDNYLELGFVEVSSDGQNFFRFPAISLTDTVVQVGGFDTISPNDIHNFAGKHRAMYGTPFDLEEMKNISGLNVNTITHVRIVDAVGSINPLYASRDSEGRMVNEPWPTEFASSGFDLDAVGVINFFFESVEENNPAYFSIYPNPGNGRFHILAAHPLEKAHIVVSDLSGRQLRQIEYSGELDLSDLENGAYIITVKTSDASYSSKLIICQ